MPVLLDHTGQPFRKGDLAREQTAGMAQLRRAVPGHPARRITPQRLMAIFAAAEAGNWHDQAELFADMEERNAHLFAELDKRRRAVLGVGWEVRPPRDSTPEEDALTTRVREALYAVRPMETLLSHLLDAVGDGFACVEITWGPVDGLLLPVTAELRPQTWFTADKDDRSLIRLRTPGSPNGEPLRPLNWIVHQHRALSGYPGRQALKRVLAWPFLLAQYAAHDWAEFLEAYGLPVKLGKFPLGSTEEQKRALLAALTEIGHSAAGVIPDTMQVELLQAVSGSADPFSALIAWSERSISKAVLGGTLTTQADGKSSTHALGVVHNEVRHDIMESDAQQLQATLLAQLVAPIVHLNFGRVPFARLPWIQFDTRQKEDLESWSNAVPRLVSVGVQIPEPFVREKLNIPEPKAGERVLSPTYVPTAPATTANEPATRSAAAAASLGALYALGAAAGNAPDPGPTSAYAARVARESAPGLAATVDAIARMVEGAPSLGVLRQRLVEAFGDLPAENIEAVLRLACSAAQLAGRAQVREEVFGRPAGPSSGGGR